MPRRKPDTEFRMTLTATVDFSRLQENLQTFLNNMVRCAIPMIRFGEITKIDYGKGDQET